MRDSTTRAVRYQVFSPSTFRLLLGRKGAKVTCRMQQCAPRAYVEADPDAIAHNLNVARRISPNTQMMAVVKADAYGHGMEATVKRLEAENPAFFGVANVTEARRVASVGCGTRPFLLGPTVPGEREEIAGSGWGFTISSMEEAEHFSSIAASAGTVLAAHLALDTGMGREGFLPSDLGEALPHLLRLPALGIEGVMSHMPVADEDENFSRRQIEIFEECVGEISRHVKLRYIHLAASAGIMRYRIPAANMARPGLMLYGVSPVRCPVAEQLRSTLRLVASVTLVRTLPAGHGVSYGCSFVTAAPTRVATIGIGYADGWRRHFSGKGICVLIRGVLCPSLGRVTMDQIMVDVSGVPGVTPGDEAELIGPSLRVEKLAEQAGTIPWDIFTGLGPRLPRITRSLG